MNTRALEKFAQNARRQLHEQVGAKLERVLSLDTAELRANTAATNQLRQEIKGASRAAVIERVAYTWFNRFCALRYMDANGYTPVGIVSPAPGFTQPELLQEAKQGVIDPALEPYLDRERLFALLGGRLPAADPQQEAYRLLLVAACNQQHETMPFLFEPIDDYTELLLPDDLLSAGSVLHATREALTAEACRELGVEIIGWLYQFYIAEKKDAVIGAKRPISADNIPAATQLFTPHWIVRYLLENSLGRLWLLNRPTSRLAERMDYYVPPQPESDENNSEKIRVHPRSSAFIRVTSPEELRICDPAAGSGHMLTYAFDLLYAIYEEEGYAAADIPRLILTHNLYGLEIDERAGALAAFALAMKAREKDRRFFRRGVAPNILVLRPIRFSEEEIGDWRLESGEWRVGSGEWGAEEREGLIHDLQLFREADNFGSLLRPQLSAGQLAELRQRVEAAGSQPQGDWLAQARQRRIGRALLQAEVLARPYHVVVTNPPYLGNFDERMKKFAKAEYPDSKSDTFAMFMERNLELAAPRGLVAMVNMQSWMFLSSYEKLREKLLKRYTIRSMAHLGARAFDTISGEVVSTTAFVLENAYHPDETGAYFRLVDGRSEAEKAAALRQAVRNPDCGWFYRASAADFQKIPGSPIAYWVTNALRDLFRSGKPLSATTDVKAGMATTDNNLFLRYWYEVAINNINFSARNANDVQSSDCHWYPLNKGGNFRKWFGNLEYVVLWYKNGQHIREYISARPEKQVGGRLVNTEYYFKECITWSDVSSGYPSFRYLTPGFVIGNRGPAIFSEKTNLDLLAYLNSPVTRAVLNVLNPTLTYNVGNIGTIPYFPPTVNNPSSLHTTKLINISRLDWNTFELSWDFSELPLLRAEFRRDTLAATYAALRQHWRGMVAEMQRLEEENNRLFIEAYGLQAELTPEVPLSEITLTCNPHYRYSGQGSKGAEEQGRLLAARWPEVAAGWPQGEAGLELRLLADTMRELVSYAVGCMFGRYSLDKPGLILANQGETLDDYLRKVRGSRRAEEQGSGGAGEQRSGGEGVLITRHSPLTTNHFLPDKDNAIPMLDGEWFEDDVTERFKRFLRVAFGEERYEENLAFVEAALGRDVRGYFLREFYDDHVRRYQKRPIYWLFSSPGGHFNALVYLHRYRPDTVSVVLNDYLREFRSKLTARRAHLERVERSAAATPREKSRALKEMGQLDKMLHDLRDYEDHILYPLATRQVALDLDDGVKVNYGKLGRALRRVAGLSE